MNQGKTKIGRKGKALGVTVKTDQSVPVAIVTFHLCYFCTTLIVDNCDPLKTDIPVPFFP